MTDIRAYSPADLDPVVILWKDSWISTNPSFGASVTYDELRERLPREIAGGWSVHVVEADGAIVGFIALTARTVEQLFVAPLLKRQGIGRQLLDFAKHQLPEGFFLTASADNTDALRFYRREGLQARAPSLHPRFGYAVVTFEWQGAGP